ncbi:MAG: metallophosphoesterase [Betaproteobacteria bacterium]
MKLHILSDLHLGFHGFGHPATDADIVILAGDIARPNQAMTWALQFGKPVLYVAGNHEFYGGSIPGTRAELRRLSAGTPIRVLDNDQFVSGGVRFLGATLWTDFALLDDEGQRRAAIDEAMQWIRDFSRIRRDDDAQARFTPHDSARLFGEHAAWLAARLAEPHPGPTVVITHHAPSPKSIHPRFAESLLNSCFVSNAEYLFGGQAVQLWIHGHTHDSFDYTQSGTRVLCNPRGYAADGIDENPLFDPCLVVEIDENFRPQPGLTGSQRAAGRIASPR